MTKDDLSYNIGYHTIDRDESVQIMSMQPLLF